MTSIAAVGSGSQRQTSFSRGVHGWRRNWAINDADGALGTPSVHRFTSRESSLGDSTAQVNLQRHTTALQTTSRKRKSTDTVSLCSYTLHWEPAKTLLSVPPGRTAELRVGVKSRARRGALALHWRWTGHARDGVCPGRWWTLPYNRSLLAYQLID